MGDRTPVPPSASAFAKNFAWPLIVGLASAGVGFGAHSVIQHAVLASQFEKHEKLYERNEIEVRGNTQAMTLLTEKLQNLSRQQQSTAEAVKELETLHRQDIREITRPRNRRTK